MLELIASRQHSNGIRAEILQYGSEGAFHVEVIDPKTPLATERAPGVQTETTLEAAKRDADDRVVASGHRCDDDCEDWQDTPPP